MTTPPPLMSEPLAPAMTEDGLLIVPPNPEDRERTRLSADDWARAALDLLAEQGVAAVAVEPLARRLGVTKGSFYWHFSSRDALLQAALDVWEAREQEVAFIPLLERMPEPRERMRALIHMIAEEYTSHVIFAELIKAAEHPCVQPVIERVSKRRLDYLTIAFRQAGMDATDAQHRARLGYTAYIGFLQLNLRLRHARMSQEEFAAYIEHVIHTLVPM